MNATAATLPLTLPAKLRPEGSALLVIDMQNDFCAPGGYIDTVMKKPVDAAAAVVAPIETLLRVARSSGVPVVWVKADYSHDRIPPPMLAKLRARGISAVCCEPGTWGAGFFGVHPSVSEAQVVKHSYSGFIRTELDAVLRGLAVRTLVFAGVQTQVCVESTVRDGHSLGYHCVVPQDAVGSHTPALHDATLDNVRFLFGDVCSSADVVGAWSSSVHHH